MPMTPLIFLTLLVLPVALATTTDPNEFLRASCAATLYPRTCLQSLAPYSSTFQSNPIRIAATATNLTLAVVRVVSAHLASLAVPSSTGSRIITVLVDCKKNFNDADDLVKQSLEELEALLKPEGNEKAKWHVGNAQTWMSAALTYGETCTDELEPFAGGPDGNIAAEVGAKVKNMKEYTSNALALVNKILPHKR